MPWDYKGIGEAKFFMSPIDSTHSPNFLIFMLPAKFYLVEFFKIAVVSIGFHLHQF